MVLCCLANIQLSEEKDVEAFLKAFKDMTEFVRWNEPGTLTYDLHSIAAEPDATTKYNFWIVERYAENFDFDKIHMTSEPMKELTKVVQAFSNHKVTLLRMTDELVKEKFEPLPDTPMAELVERTRPHRIVEKGVLVFAGSSTPESPSFIQEAGALGALIAEKVKMPLVYGGGSCGMMGAVADAVRSHGGRICSIIPQSLCTRECAGEVTGDILYFTESLAERESIMFGYAEMVVVLPGGIGTFRELLSLLTLYQLNCFRVKIGLVNVGGFFDTFVSMLENLTTEGFLEKTTVAALVVRSTAKELIKAMEAPEMVPSAASGLKWRSRF